MVVRPTRRRFLAGAAASLALARPAIVRAAEPLVVCFVPANSIHWIQDVAIDKGFYRDVGFEPQVAILQSSPQSIQGAISGAYHIATSQPEPFVAAVEHGAVNLAAQSAPMNRADWALTGSPSVRSLDDLKGKLIGVSGLRTSEVWLTTQLLEKNGLKKGEFDFITVGTSPAKITGLNKGSIGAAVLYQPTAELAIKQGLTLLSRYGALRAYPPILYVVNRDWASRGDAGKRVAQAVRRGHEWLWDPGNRAEAIGILGRHTKMERKLLDAVYDEYFVNAKIYAKRGEIELAGLDLALADMARDGAIIKPPAPPATKYVLARDMGGLVA